MVEKARIYQREQQIFFLSSIMSLLRNTLSYLLFLRCLVWAYPQQITDSPTLTAVSTSTVTAVLQTIDLEGFDIGGETLSGFEQDYTTISIVGISTGTGSDGKSETETTYSREILVSDAILTIATDGSLEPNTLVAGNIITYLNTIVENASGYYISEADDITSGTVQYSEGTYETCSFAGPNAVSAGCSDSDYLMRSSTTVYQSLEFSASVGTTTMTLPVQVVATPQVSSSGSATTSSSGASQSNSGVSQKSGCSMIGASLLAYAVVFLSGLL
ncbi:hypothetical protein GGU11DRAFT_454252 [Lentinula aff. detonsa]|nr:hypothetical protein GGU11DRAFT_454252 [Lentinula aff. detonsa]